MRGRPRTSLLREAMLYVWLIFDSFEGPPHWNVNGQRYGKREEAAVQAIALFEWQGLFCKPDGKCLFKAKTLLNCLNKGQFKVTHEPDRLLQCPEALPLISIIRTMNLCDITARGRGQAAPTGGCALSAADRAGSKAEPASGRRCASSPSRSR
jgi:hypothetical protein